MTHRTLVATFGLFSFFACASASATARAQEHAQEQPAEIDPRDLRAALAHYAQVEPSVDEVVRLALRESTNDLSEVHSVATRARLSALLPRLRVSAQRGTGWDLSERLDETGRVQLGTDDSLMLRGEVLFPLDRLVFAREEVPLLREQRAVRLMRQDLVRTVVRVYYERRRLMLERDLLDAAGLDHALRIEEASALLNAFTGGAFGRGVRSR
jgi:hypothetical protein